MFKKENLLFIFIILIIFGLFLFAGKAVYLDKEFTEKNNILMEQERIISEKIEEKHNDVLKDIERFTPYKTDSSSSVPVAMKIEVTFIPVFQ